MASQVISASSPAGSLRPFLRRSPFLLWSFLSPERRQDWRKTILLHLALLPLGLSGMVVIMLEFNVALTPILWVSGLGMAFLGRLYWFLMKHYGAQLAYDQEEDEVGSLDRHAQEQASARLARRLGVSLPQAAPTPVRRARL